MRLIGAFLATAIMTEKSWIYVFVAGPMSTSGEPGPNLNAAAVASATLMKLGFVPFVPHVTWVLHAITPEVEIEAWKRWDLLWIERCDCVLRLPGESEGADGEVDYASAIEKPVFHTMADLAYFYGLSEKYDSLFNEWRETP